MTLRAVVFAAVSDPGQLKNDSVPQQITKGQEVIRQRGWREVHPPLEVPGISRSYDFLADAVEQVPAISKLLQLARDQLVDIVVVRHTNRLARTAALLLQISAYLRKHKVQIFAWETPLEPKDPAELGRLADTTRLMVEGFSGLIAEADNIHRSRRNQDGMLTRIRRGGHPAGQAPFGYKDVIAEDGVGHSHRKRVVNPAEYPILCEILQMLKTGYSSRYIAQLLAGEIDGRAPIVGRRGARLSAEVILQWAYNPYYYGKTYRGWYKTMANGKRGRPRKEPLVLVDSGHECPMTWDDRAIILRYIQERDTVGPRWKMQKRPWSSIAFCAYCLEAGRHGAMRYRLDVQTNLNGLQRRYEYLYCNYYSTTGVKGCRRNAMRLADFLARLVEEIQLVADDPVARAALETEPDPRPDQTARLLRELDDLLDAERQWDDAFERKVIDVHKYGERLQDIRRRRSLLQEQLVQEQRLREATGEARRQRDEALERFGAVLATGDPMEISRLVRQIVEKVIVREGELTIVWR